MGIKKRAAGSHERDGVGLCCDIIGVSVFCPMRACEIDAPFDSQGEIRDDKISRYGENPGRYFFESHHFERSSLF